MSKQQQFRRSYTRVMSAILVVLGVVLVIRTLTAGGGPAAAGVLLGILFVLAGAARLYLQYRGR
jgi:drug/metabolite transporter (DMT)-like permease